MIEETTAGILPPTQYLMMEVCAARHRLGEPYWTFPRSMTNIARSLQIRRLVRYDAGVMQDTIRVWITTAGVRMFLSDAYAPPTKGKKKSRAASND